MVRFALVGLLLLPLSGGALAASSQTLTVKSLGVSITFPDGWETRSEDDGVMGKKGMTGVMLRTSEKGTVDEAVDEMRANLGRIVPNAKLGEKKKTTLGGMKGLVFPVTGGPKDMALKGTLTFVQVGKGKVASILAMGPAPEFEREARTVEGILGSLRKAKRK